MRVGGLSGRRPPVNAPRVYSAPLRLLHGVTAVLVVAQFALAATNALVYESRPVLAEAVVQAHLSIGAVVLVLTMIRLIGRLSRPAPVLPNDMSIAWKTSARMVHMALYLLLILLPVTGYVKLAALGFQISVFGLVALPALPFNTELAALARTAHLALAILLCLMVFGHVLAAVFHARLFGCPILHRMWPVLTRSCVSAQRSVLKTNG